MASQTHDIVIVGGSLGGVAAALRAGAAGCSVCLLEPTDWLGGQFSAQGVTRPDENRFIEAVGSTASYRDFRHEVRAFYRNNYNLSESGAAQPTLDPGGSFPGFSCEPRVAHNVLLQKLQALPTVHVRLNARVSGASVQNNAVQSLTVTGPDGTQTDYAAKYPLDATDLGELLTITGIEHTLGAEARSQTNEPLAPPQARPDWIQPITMVVALERRPAGENHLIAQPAGYDQLKEEQNYSIKDGYISTVFASGKDLWSYRRYIDASNFDDPSFPNDLSMLNMGSNDYQAATIPTGSPQQDAAVIARARLASLGYVYWLQTECPRDDGSGLGYPELMVRTDQFGTADGTSAQPYIRESRRIVAQYTVVQQDLDQAFNAGPRAKNYYDSCGIGLYGGLDIHGLAGVGMLQNFISIKPFEIPLRSLIPIRVTNVLPACKNIGTTHITNGAYRLHPVEWNVGEASGALAAFAIANNVSPAQVPNDASLLRKYQRGLLSTGVHLFWWTDVLFGDAAFESTQLCGVAGIMSGEGNDLNFRPQDDFGISSQAAVEANLGRKLNWPQQPITRAQAATWIVGQLGW
ncbi:MAG TPA: FAD-dependent oxidoreductase [Candidatus Acidoferrales bacterium]|nr:FAD-dependent oxidoreductase [Candidatus Acidoferrales bacterium]